MTATDNKAMTTMAQSTNDILASRRHVCFPGRLMPRHRAAADSSSLTLTADIMTGTTTCSNDRLIPRILIASRTSEHSCLNVGK